MARALDGSALGIYCRRLQLSADGVEAVVRVRDSPPARTPKGRRGNMPIFFPSEKMGRIIKAESHRIEYARLLENEHDADVLEQYDQPPAIPLDYLDTRGHRQQPQHVADFFVIRTHSAGWEECKPSEELTLLGKRQPQRYVCDTLGVWHCPPGEAYAATLGLTYHVFPSDHINWVAQSNWQYLDTYYRDAAHLSVAEEVLAQLDGLLDETPGMNWADVRRRLPEIDADAFHTALIHHRIYVDLATYRLEDQARIAIPVYRDRAMALAASHGAVAPVPDLGIEARPVMLETGTPITWDGKAWQIANPGATEVTLLDGDGMTIAVPITTFTRLVTEGTIAGVRQRERTCLTPAGMERLARASPQDFAIGVFRQRVICPADYEDTEQHQLQEAIAKVPRRTFYRWKQLFRLGEVTYGSGFIGLLPDLGSGGGPRIASEVAALIEQVLEDYFDTTTRRLKRGAYGEYLLRSAGQGVKQVSQRTFYAHARCHKTAYEQAYARGGRRYAYPHKEAYHGQVRTTNPQGLYAWDKGYLDHTPLDIALRDSETFAVLGSAWLSWLILGQPRRIVATVLSYDPPSYRTCLLLLRNCVRRYGRLPDGVVVDGGKEFSSIYFEQLLALYRIRKHARPAAEPRFGSPQERLFGTMDTEILYHLLGNTQALAEPRTVGRDADPRRQATWTLPVLTRRIQAWIDEEYDPRPHPATDLRGLSPRQAYERSLIQDGSRRHQLIPYDDAFIKSTMPSTRTGTALVQPGQGVHIHYVDYLCEAMRDATVERTQVPVRYNPFNRYEACAYIHGRWRDCQAAFQEFVGCSEREMALMADEIRQQQRLLHGRTHIEITQEHLARYRRDNMAEETLLRQQRADHETRVALEALGETSPSAIPAPVLPSPASSAEVSPGEPTREATAPRLLVFRRRS